MSIDFDQIIDRRNSDSLKWSGCGGNHVIPMWIADMDFAAPECVIRALRERVDQGVFGYPRVTDEVTQSVVNWAESHYRWRIDPEWIVWLPGLVPGIHVACLALAGTRTRSSRSSLLTHRSFQHPASRAGHLRRSRSSGKKPAGLRM